VPQTDQSTDEQLIDISRKAALGSLVPLMSGRDIERAG